MCTVAERGTAWSERLASPGAVEQPEPGVPVRKLDKPPTSLTVLRTGREGPESALTSELCCGSSWDMGFDVLVRDEKASCRPF